MIFVDVGSRKPYCGFLRIRRVMGAYLDGKPFSVGLVTAVGPFVV